MARETAHSLPYVSKRAPCFDPHDRKDAYMNNIIYIVGLVVVVIAVLSFFGFR